MMSAQVIFRAGTYVIVGLAQVICILLGFICLFGSLFCEVFNALTVAGICSVVAGFLPASRRGPGTEKSKAILLVAVVGLLATTLDVVAYYLFHNFPGNSYAWLLAIVLFGSLLIMAFYGAARARANTLSATQ